MKLNIFFPQVAVAGLDQPEYWVSSIVELEDGRGLAIVSGLEGPTGKTIGFWPVCKVEGAWRVGAPVQFPLAENDSRFFISYPSQIGDWTPSAFVDFESGAVKCLRLLELRGPEANLRPIVDCYDFNPFTGKRSISDAIEIESFERKFLQDLVPNEARWREVKRPKFPPARDRAFVTVEDLNFLQQLRLYAEELSVGRGVRSTFDARAGKWEAKSNPRLLRWLLMNLVTQFTDPSRAERKDSVEVKWTLEAYPDTIVTKVNVAGATLGIFPAASELQQLLAEDITLTERDRAEIGSLKSLSQCASRLGGLLEAKKSGPNEIEALLITRRRPGRAVYWAEIPEVEDGILYNSIKIVNQGERFIEVFRSATRRS